MRLNILCKLGIHKWIDSFYTKNRNHAIGRRCAECKTWHKTAVKWKGNTNE